MRKVQVEVSCNCPQCHALLSDAKKDTAAQVSLALDEAGRRFTLSCSACGEVITSIDRLAVTAGKSQEKEDCLQQLMRTISTTTNMRKWEVMRMQRMVARQLFELIFTEANVRRIVDDAFHERCARELERARERVWVVMRVPLFSKEIEPTEPFSQTHIDPENTRVQALGSFFERKQPMTVRERRRVSERVAELSKLLTRARYDEALAELSSLAAAFKQGSEVVTLPDTGERLARKAVALRGRRLKEEVARLQPMVTERESLLDDLEQDDRLMADLAVDSDHKKVLTKSCFTYGDLILNTWSGLGYCKDAKGHGKGQKIEFERVETDRMRSISRSSLRGVVFSGRGGRCRPACG